MAVPLIFPLIATGMGAYNAANVSGNQTESYANVNNPDSPFSWAYTLHRGASNTLIPGNADYYKQIEDGTIKPSPGWTLDFTRKNEQIDQAAAALADIYDMKRPINRLPVGKQYFTKAGHFLQNLEHAPIYLSPTFTSNLGRQLFVNRTKDLGFTGENQLQDVANLAELYGIFDQFGSNNIRNQFNKFGKSPSIFSFGMTDGDIAKFGNAYKVLAKALQEGDYEKFRPYLTEEGMAELLKKVEEHKTSTGHTIANEVQSWFNVPKIVTEEPSKVLPLNPKNNNPVMTVMKQLQGEQYAD